jgi:hypothetical protein
LTAQPPPPGSCQHQTNGTIGSSMKLVFERCRCGRVTRTRSAAQAACVSTWRCALEPWTELQNPGPGWPTVAVIGLTNIVLIGYDRSRRLRAHILIVLSVLGPRERARRACTGSPARFGVEDRALSPAASGTSPSFSACATAVRRMPGVCA